VKNRVIALTALCCTTGAAYAQSSVTLYGIVDAGFTYNSNVAGNRQYALTSGNGAGDRWGLKGVEQLGGGLAAIFDIESGFSIMNGTTSQGGTPFGRQVYTGLSSGMGSVTLGRQTALTNDFVANFSSGSTWAAAGTGYGSHVGDLDNLVALNRTNNSIKYRSPEYRGLTVSSAYAFGGVPGTLSQDQIWELGASYSGGPFKLGAGYLLAKNPNYSFFGNEVKSSTTGSNLTASPAYAGYASAGSQQIIAVGGSYTAGALVVSTVYSNVQFSSLGQTTVAGLTAQENAYRGSATFNTGELNLQYFLSPEFMLGLAYNYTKLDGVGGQGARYQQINAGGRYYLSKSTDIYTVAIFQRAGGTDSTGRPAVATITGVTPSGGRYQTVVTAGIEKKF
jgi:predicted porin